MCCILSYWRCSRASSKSEFWTTWPVKLPHTHRVCLLELYCILLTQLSVLSRVKIVLQKISYPSRTRVKNFVLIKKVSYPFRTRVCSRRIRSKNMRHIKYILSFSNTSMFEEDKIKKYVLKKLLSKHIFIKNIYFLWSTYFSYNLYIFKTHIFFIKHMFFS